MSSERRARTPWAIPLAEIDERAPDAVGAKSLNLARMLRAGLPVPPAFCVTTAAYRAHLETNGLESAIQDADGAEPDGRRRALDTLRRALARAPLPVPVDEAIAEEYRALVGCAGAAVPLAVRSSATSEDLPGSSFAGQHDSFLGVEGLAACREKVRECWASLWTERAFEYRTRRGIDHLSADMAVIVQRLVPAEFAGVLFTVDPATGRRDRFVIEAVEGLGDSLVSGRAAPERLVISRRGPALVHRGGDGSKRRLDAAVALDLARLALEAESHLGGPLDIEWAITGGETWLLQARPVTGLAAREPTEVRQVWSNANTGEVLPDVVTPMTWSAVKPVVRALLGRFLDCLGFDLDARPIFGLVAGRAYYHLNSVMAFSRLIPAMGDEAITEFFGGRQDLAAKLGEIDLAREELPRLRFRPIALAIRIPHLLFRYITLSPRRAQSLLERVRAEVDAEAAIPLRDLSPAELVALMRSSIERQARDGEMFDSFGLSLLSTALLGRGARLWMGDEGLALVSLAQSGLGNNDMARAGLDLSRLARRVREEGLEAAVEEASGMADLRAKGEGSEAVARFLAAWDLFLRDHGHHCRGELELTNPRWAEVPDEVLRHLRACLKASADNGFLERYEKLGEGGVAAGALAHEKLRGPFRRMALRFLLKRSRETAPLRENLKNQLVRRFADIRRIVLELGERLAAAGMLERPSDVFFLELGEAEEAARAPGNAGELRERVLARRAEHERNQALQPPSIVIEPYDPAADAAQLGPSDSMLTGLGIVPGIVRGPARVILRDADDRVLPGEILVAPYTDPGWTPYFLNAAAIVVDLGGMLSHGSIIAREFGIPAVVNVGPATRIIRTGQLVEVDGARGTVRVIG